MSIDQATTLAHWLILLTNAFLYLLVKRKLIFATGRAMNEAVKRSLTGRS